MGTKDTITKSYLKENHVFADVINCFVYQGVSVVREEQLKEMDTNVLTLPENIKLAKNAMNLIVPAEIPDEKIMKLQTNLREVLLIIKYSKDKESLRRIVQENPERMQRMERKAAMVVKEYTNWEFHEEEEEETMDVCQAVKDWAIEEQMIGEQRGREIGKIEGVQQEKMETALKMLENHFEENVIIRITGLSEDQIRKINEKRKEK